MKNGARHEKLRDVASSYSKKYKYFHTIYGQTSYKCKASYKKLVPSAFDNSAMVLA